MPSACYRKICLLLVNEEKPVWAVCWGMYFLQRENFSFVPPHESIAAVAKPDDFLAWKSHILFSFVFLK